MLSPKNLKSFKKGLIFSLFDKKRKKSLLKTNKLKNNYKSLSDNEEIPKDSTSFSFSFSNKLDKLDKNIEPYQTIIMDKNIKNNKIKEQINNNLDYSKIILQNYGDMEDEKIKLKNILNDLISWGNKNNKMKNNTKDNNSPSNINAINNRIKKIKFNKSELISFIKNNIEDNNNKDTTNIFKNETKKNLLKLKFSVFDNDFTTNKYKDQEQKIEKDIINNNRKIEEANIILEKNNYKLFQKEQKQNELKERESLMFIYKKLVMNKLKKKKYLELLDDTYRLLEKARIEYQLSVDILNKRLKSTQNYYIAFINIFKGKIIKLNERKIKRRKSNDNIENVEKENNNSEKRDFSPDINKIKNRYSIIGYEEKLKKYREYLSIIDDINNEINKYDKKFNSIQNDLNNILNKTSQKIEEINKETNQIKIIYKELNHKQTKYYLNILKKGIDTRMEGLSWVVKRLIELNVPIDSTIFPGFLDQEQIDYIIQISKYGYEITQLKIILDNLRERNTELSEKERNQNNSYLGYRNDKNISFSNISKSSKKDRDKKKENYNNESEELDNKLMIYFKKSKDLLSKYSKIINNETKNFEIENNIVNLMLKNVKNKLGLYARDDSFNMNDKRDIKSNIFKFILSNDKQKEYFHDVFILIERIKKLNNLIKESKKEELLIFGEKFKFADLKEETTKTFYWQVFNALFGNTFFK